MLSTTTLAMLISEPCCLLWDCLLVLLPFSHPQRYLLAQRISPSTGLFDWMKELARLFSEPEGRRTKDEWTSAWVFCSCAAVFQRNPQALSAEWQTCALAAAQDPCLIISYLNKCSSIRVWLLARHLGKDLVYISSPVSQGEKACGLLCGRAAGYEVFVALSPRQTDPKKHSGYVSTLPGQPCWQESQGGEIMSSLYCHCAHHGTQAHYAFRGRGLQTAWRINSACPEERMICLPASSC